MLPTADTGCADLKESTLGSTFLVTAQEIRLYKPSKGFKAGSIEITGSLVSGIQSTDWVVSLNQLPSVACSVRQ